MDAHKTPIAAFAFPAAAFALVVALALAAEIVADSHAVAHVVVPVIATAVLIGCVFAALHHAEIVGARVGEPYGTLILTLSVTIIEVAIVATMMLSGENNPTLAREAVFSVFMIVCAGLVGLCLFIGAARHFQQDLSTQGASAYLTVIIALSVMTLVLPDFTETTVGPTFSRGQLVFVTVASILLYAAFLFVQTVRHRDHFAEVSRAGAAHAIHAVPTGRRALVALIALLASLLGVIFLAKKVAVGIEEGLAHLHPVRFDAITGAVIALLVLMPEAAAAVRAAARNALQTSLNISLGSALATIGLTIPAVAVVSLITGREVVLGLPPRDAVMLFLVLAISIVSFGTGRTNMLSGLVHLVVFAAYVLFLFVP